MEESFVIDICGRREELPVMRLENGPKIAFFNLHGNVELTEFCAYKLAERLKGKADVILTAESKGLQLAHCVARRLEHGFYAVARKSKKLYMQDGISVAVKSITTKGEQRFYLSAHDAKLLNGKSVAVVDDVISSGGSIEALCELVRAAGGQVAVKAAVLAEGEAAQRDDILFLSPLPIWE